MGSGATGMPNDQRVLEREFTYANFNQLIGSAGLRQATAVPEPGALAIFGTGLLIFAGVLRRRQAAL